MIVVFLLGSIILLPGVPGLQSTRIPLVAENINVDNNKTSINSGEKTPVL